jgi:multidrug efflux pump subunit AcrA (membrane-fusion protein)
MFGRVKVPGSEPYEALLVPDVAIGTEQIRKYVMVVDKEDKVAPKYVTLGELSGDLRVIRSGLAPDDRIVINGLARLRPGIKVSPKTEAPAKADAKPKTD